MRLASISCCFRPRMASRSAKSGTSIIMSLLNTSAPGEVLIAWLIEHLRAWTQLYRALSTACSASLILVGASLEFAMVLNMDPMVACIRSHTALDCGFFTVVFTWVIPALANRDWNSCPMNSPPLSEMHLFGFGYRLNHRLVNWSATCLLVLLLIRMISGKLLKVLKY